MEDRPDVNAKIVLIRCGGCISFQKIQNVMAYDNKYIIIYNDASVTANIRGNVNGFVAIFMITARQDETRAKFIATGSEIIISMAYLVKAGVFYQEFDNIRISSIVSDFVNPQFGASGGKILSIYTLWMQVTSKLWPFIGQPLPN